MLSFAPFMTALLSVLPSAPVRAPAPVPRAAPTVCFVEVRLREVSEASAATASQASTDASGRRPGRLLARGTLEFNGTKAMFKTGERIPFTTYSFDNKGWKAHTTFNDTGVSLQLMDAGARRDRTRELAYECQVSCVLDVVAGTKMPILGNARWSGTGTLGAEKPLVLTALSRIDGRLLRVPRNHPLHDGRADPPMPDRIVEIEVTVKLAKGPGSPPK